MLLLWVNFKSVLKAGEHMTQRYQRGSLRRESRKNGDVWVWRYRIQGVMRQETYSVAEFPNKFAMWTRLETSIKLLNNKAQIKVKSAYTVSDAARMFRESHNPTLRKSSQDVNEWLLGEHIEPKWGKYQLGDIRPADVDRWVKSLRLSSISKAHVMTLFRQLFKKAMLWGMYPVGFNPLTLVTVKGATEREEEPEILTPEQVVLLVSALPYPYGTMVLVASSLGLRVSETVALRWEDFDLEKGTVLIRRSYTRQSLNENTKSRASKARIPIGAAVLDLLKSIRPDNLEGWVFPSPRTDKPLSAGTILTKHIQPTAKALGLPKIGWHDLRHSFRSWISSEAQLTVQKDMVRHADVSTTANIYGRTPIEDMRPIANKVASRLKPPATIH